MNDLDLLKRHHLKQNISLTSLLNTFFPKLRFTSSHLKFKKSSQCRIWDQWRENHKEPLKNYTVLAARYDNITVLTGDVPKISLLFDCFHNKTISSGHAINQCQS